MVSMLFSSMLRVVLAFFFAGGFDLAFFIVTAAGCAVSPLSAPPPALEADFCGLTAAKTKLERPAFLAVEPTTASFLVFVNSASLSRVATFLDKNEPFNLFAPCKRDTNQSMERSAF